MNMQNWAEGIRTGKVKKAFPILSFPSVQLLNITVEDLIADSDMQAKAMKTVSDRADSLASVSMMDLSVEAEAFGSRVKTQKNEIPAIDGTIICSYDDAVKLQIPAVGEGREKIYIKAIEKAASLIDDRAVFAGVIGPFSLAGRLMGVSEAMMGCYDEPDTVHLLLKKASEHIREYIGAYKKAGANGVVMAEPLAGMLSPALADEFSCSYVSKIASDVQDESFAFIYHNCGNNTVHMIDSIMSIGALAYHFGNAVSMTDVIKKADPDTLVMGNIDPSRYFLSGTKDEMRTAVTGLLEQMKGHDNFVLSSGCDLAPMSKWENIDAFFAAADEFYGR